MFPATTIRRERDNRHVNRPTSHRVKCHPSTGTKPPIAGGIWSSAAYFLASVVSDEFPNKFAIVCALARSPVTVTQIVRGLVPRPPDAFAGATFPNDIVISFPSANASGTPEI